MRRVIVLVLLLVGCQTRIYWVPDDGRDIDWVQFQRDEALCQNRASEIAGLQEPLDALLNRSIYLKRCMLVHGWVPEEGR